LTFNNIASLCCNEFILQLQKVQKKLSKAIIPNCTIQTGSKLFVQSSRDQAYFLNTTLEHVKIW